LYFTKLSGFRCRVSRDQQIKIFDLSGLGFSTQNVEPDMAGLVAG